MIDLEIAKNVAIKAARLAGAHILEKQGKIKDVETKGIQDFVSEADKESEKIIIDNISEKYPDHSISSEEIGDIDKKSDYVWVVDPIDATRNFLYDVPIFAVSIGLMHKGKIVLGVVYDPSNNNMFSAYSDGGAWKNDKRIHVSEESNIRNSFMYFDGPGMNGLDEKGKEIASERLKDLSKIFARVRSFGCAALGMCYLAQGSFEGFLDLSGKLKMVDIAGASIIVKEAGGMVTTDKGEKIKSADDVFLASNGKVHKGLIDILGRHPFD